jgi:hypothetical protein
MKAKFSILFIFLCITFACNNIKNKTKEAIKETGQAVGSSTTEFINAVSEGIDKALNCELLISKQLIDKGLSTGKFKIENTEKDIKNKLSIYFIYKNDLNINITISISDSKGLEYGRINQRISGKANNAGFVDFIFDKRTNIESKSIIKIE